MRQKFLFAIFKVFEIIVLAFSAIYIGLYSPNLKPWILILAYSILLLISISEIWIRKKEKIANCELLVKFFYELVTENNEDDIRITIHKRISQKKYIQYINYIPRGSKRGNKHLIEKGIVSFAFNKKGHFSENFETEKEKIEKLIEKYNFTHNEATQMAQDGKMSYYCKSIFYDDKIWGVLYLTSKSVGFFPTNENLNNSEVSFLSDNLIKCLEDEID